MKSEDKQRLTNHLNSGERLVQRKRRSQKIRRSQVNLNVTDYVRTQNETSTETA